jgi:hypothetical protein
MKRLAMLLILACACASSTSDSSPVDVRIADVHLSGDIRYAGPMAVQFVVEVTNPTSSTVTLRHVEIRTVASGNFAVRASTSFDRAIKPGETASVELHANGTSAGGRLASDEPITLRGTATFDSPKGAFTKLFQDVLQVQ